MGNGALPDIGDDFHIPMRVRVKPLPRRDFIIIPNPEPPPIHAARVAVMAEGKMVIGIEPTEIRLAQAIKGTKFDHGYPIWPLVALKGQIGVRGGRCQGFGVA
jgi:hypothetical protein